MIGHEFKYTRDNHSGATIQAPDYLTVSELFDEFHCYLLACGYQQGSIDSYHEEAACLLSQTNEAPMP